MTNTGIRIAAVGMVFYLVTSAASAEAAKGVKKNAGNAHQTVSGIVTSITPNKTGYGTFQIRTAHHHKKVANPGANGGNGHHTVSVTASTRFEHHNGGAVSMVNAMALQRGQHVRVQTTSGQQAQNVHILTSNRSNRSRGYYTRHRSSSYRPQYAQYPHYSHHSSGVHSVHHVHHTHRR